MAVQDNPTLTIVAGREGPTEGPYSNAARIADVKAKMSAGPKKRKRRGPYKPRAPKPKRDINAERVEAYSDLEEHICDCVNMGMAAVHLALDGERDLAVFMLHQLRPLLQGLRKRYYANGFNEA
jgi:hypothetical protein